MTYQPLARKYRPGQFAELVGQEAVAKALANAISMGREPHALIFTGVRGVGKTTIARLYAKALNCEARLPQGSAEPCNMCASCQAISRGNHEDVLEIDGASNTGVGDVRSLQETIDYRPQRSAFKVYIIDEVHMLSGAAFNALLKTLEEPPGHVVFVFATTEIQKVPQTIMSRCQAFYLKKLPAALILRRLEYILAQEGIGAEEKALAVVAREGHGSLRDALTLLDQAIALGNGRVTVESLGWLVSNLSSAPYLELLAALTARDAARVLQVLEALDQGGADFTLVVEQAAELARHGFVLQGLGAKSLELTLLGLDDAEVATLTTLALSAGPFDLNRIFRTLVKCRGDLEGSALDRYIVENYLFEWCLDPGLPTIDQLLSSGRGSGQGQPGTDASTSKMGAGPSRTMKLSATLPPKAAAAVVVPAAPVVAPKAAVAAVAAASTVLASAPLNDDGPRRVRPPMPVGMPETWRLMIDAWKQQKPLQARKFEEAHPLEYSRQRIVLAISDDGFASKSLLGRDEQARVKEQFRELFGFEGILVIQSKPAVAAVAADVLGEAATVLPETILAERGRETLDRQGRLIEEASNAPFTRDLLSALGGKLEGVRILGSD